MKLSVSFLICWVGALSAFGFSEPSFYQPYAALLARYVEPTGVDYRAWRASNHDIQALDGFLESMAAVQVEQLDDAQQQAFFINLYNAGMIRAVLQHYPIATVTEILPGFGIFKKKFIRLGDRMLSLDGIEKGILLERWDEPRHHFAVNCASESCPPLRAEPFTGSKLDEQLDEQTQRFANSKHAAQVRQPEGKIYVSSLFNWYADDFPLEPVAYLNQYRGQPLSNQLPVGFIDYDWALNETKSSND